LLEYFEWVFFVSKEIFQCPECSEELSNKAGLFGHLRNEHGYSSSDWEDYKEEQGIRTVSSSTGTSEGSERPSRDAQLLGSDSAVKLPDETRELAQKCIDEDLAYDIPDLVNRAIRFFYVASGDLQELRQAKESFQTMQAYLLSEYKKQRSPSQLAFAKSMFEQVERDKRSKSLQNLMAWVFFINSFDQQNQRGGLSDNLLLSYAMQGS